MGLESHALSRADQEKADRLSTLMLSVLDHESTSAWRAQLLTSIKEELGADKAVSYLPSEGHEPFMCVEMPVQIPNGYPAVIKPLDRRWSIWDRQAELGVFDRRSLWDPWSRQFLRSAYYNDYVLPHRLYGAMGISVKGHGLTANTPNVPTLWLHHDRPGSLGLGDRERAILRAVIPAFTAAVEIIRVVGNRRDALTRMLDDLGCAMLLVDVAGQQVHQTPALRALLANQVEAAALLPAMLAAAGGVSRHSLIVRCRAHTTSPLDDVASELRTAAAVYRIRAAQAPRQLVGAQRMALVSVERLRSTAPDFLVLCDRFRLTPAQARVARLIADGNTPVAIADQLGCSPHTVRRHLEQLRLRIGVRRTAQIVAEVMRALN
jgi:DNA-binding CsgD family transcriptional regulator